MTATEHWVPLAEVARPHGVRGELRLRLYNPDSDLLLRQKQVRLALGEGQAKVYQVAAARRANDAILLQLQTIDDRDQADLLRGAVVEVERAQFDALAEDEFYAVDVIGAEVLEIDAAEGAQRIGVVKAYRSYPSVDVFAVSLEDGSVLEIPSLDSFVEQVTPSALRVRDLAVLREIAESAKPKPKLDPALRPPAKRGRRKAKSPE